MRQNLRGFQVGVALSGGGARGFAHIGVLQALEELGIDIDVVAGTSMGGIIGGLYAAGMTPTDIENSAARIDWGDIFSDRPQRATLLFTRRVETEGALVSVRFDGLGPQIPTALSRGQKLVNVLSELTEVSGYFSGGDFSRLDRRLAIVSTDLVSGERVVFDSGSLVDALRATMGVPLAFTPLDRDDRLLMDGGLVEPIPTQAAREAGADFVIAVNTTSTLLTKQDIADPIDIANQTTTIMSAAVRERLLANADFVYTPDLDDIKATDFRRVGEAIQAGYELVMAERDTILAALSRFRESDERRELQRVSVAVSGGVEDHASSTPPFADHIGRYQTESERREMITTWFRGGEFVRIEDQSSRPFDGHLRLQVTPLQRVSRVRFEGNRVFPDSILQRTVGSMAQNLSTLTAIASLYDSLLAFYHNEGYDLAQIKGAWIDSVAAELVVVLDEGQIVALAVEGNAKTRWWVVTSYFPLKVGDFYRKSRALTGVQEIYSSGLYDNVNLRLEEQAGGVKITILVKESKYTYARLGGRYHEVFHPEAFWRVGYANLFGTGNEISAYVRFSERRKLYQLQLRADRIFRSFLTYRLQAFYANNKISYFVEDDEVGHRTDKRWGARLGIGQQLFNLGLFEVFSRYEQIRFAVPPDGPLTERRVASIGAGLRYDSKDRYTFPTRGAALDAFVETASDVLGADEVYRRLEAAVESYQTFARKLTIHPRVAIGLSQDFMPIYDRFYLGGTRSFFGYATDQLAGDKYFLTNLEARIGPVYSLYLSGRYDFGEVFTRFEEIRFQELRHGFGVTLALDTPLGPFSASYGSADDTDGNLYLNLGLEF